MNRAAKRSIMAVGIVGVVAANVAVGVAAEAGEADNQPYRDGRLATGWLAGRSVAADSPRALGKQCPTT
jgi:hypothetical protein